MIMFGYAVIDGEAAWSCNVGEVLLELIASG